MKGKELNDFFDKIAPERDKWKQRSRYYYKELEAFCSFVIPPNHSVLEIGCGTGDLLASVKPSKGVGIDLSEEMVRIAQGKYPNLTFLVNDAESLDVNEQFDYVILSDLIGHLSDVWKAVRELKKVTKPETRIVINYYNQLWKPILNLAERLGLKMPEGCQNWLSLDDIENLLDLTDYEVVKRGYRFLFPKDIPFISTFLNKYIAKLPFIKKLCLVQYLVARERGREGFKSDNFSCSVIVPCRNEAGNIEGCVLRIPRMGRHTEVIFVDGNSTDGTIEKIEGMIEKYKDEKDIRLLHQGNGKGKGDAVRKGFNSAKGDILFILDSDLSVSPEDLPKFFDALIERQGEMIMGSRLVYPMEEQAMRTLNFLGNKIFSLIFTWLLEQRIRDTLCGTKVLFKKDYLKIVEGRGFFGDFDPFGDFDLIFGAAKLNLKIVEIPVRYKERTYGETKISRFAQGWLLLKMCLVAFRKLKLS